MMAGSHCDCLVCRIEKSLAVELGEQGASQLLDSSPALAAFPTPLDLVRALHASEDPASTYSSDRLLAELLRENTRTGGGSVWQKLLLLAFIPTIHRTTTQVRATFPSLARDDITQHVVSVFLEFLRSPELRARSSHIAFTVARKLRRSAFRWAIHDARLAPPEEAAASPAEEPRELDHLRAALALNCFFTSCERAGWLSREDRALLVESKLKGTSCRELALRNGHSAVAIQHRLGRLLQRLRQVAMTTPRQLELFPSAPARTREKIF